MYDLVWSRRSVWFSEKIEEEDEKILNLSLFRLVSSRIPLFKKANFLWRCILFQSVDLVSLLSGCKCILGLLIRLIPILHFLGRQTVESLLGKEKYSFFFFFFFSSFCLKRNIHVFFTKDFEIYVSVLLIIIIIIVLSSCVSVSRSRNIIHTLALNST